jgi:hypothetical protein
MKVENFIPEVLGMLDAKKHTSAILLLDYMQKKGIMPTNGMKISIIRKLGYHLNDPEFAHECLMTLNNPQDIPDLDKLYCKVIKICSRQIKWDLAEETFNHFKNPTPELKSALAQVYLRAGMHKKIQERGLSNYVDYEGKHTILAFIKGTQNREEAFMLLDTAKSQFEIEEFYAHKAQLMIRFEMFDELAELFKSIKKDAHLFRRFSFSGLLNFYEQKALEKDLEKVYYLRSLKLRLRENANTFVFYDFFRFQLNLFH